MGRRSKDKEKLPLLVSAYTDRHGKRRYRYRKGVNSYHFKEHPGTPTHPSAEYAQIAFGQRPSENTPIASGTVRDLVNSYYHTTKYTSPGIITQEKVRARLEDFCKAHGSKRVDTLRFNHVEIILAQKARSGVNAARKKVGGPNAAKSLEKDLVRLLDLAVKLEWIASNPARLAHGVKVPKTSGFHSWNEEEIQQYRDHYPLGTMGRLAIEIILWTLLRRGDASRFGPQHRLGGMLRVWHDKTKKWSWLPEPKQLTNAIEAMGSIDSTTYLISESGPFASPASFGMWFRRRCDAAGLPHCSAHGLRKATARRLADRGATQVQLKAAGNWSQDKDVAIYNASADQRRNADTVMTDLADHEDEL